MSELTLHARLRALGIVGAADGLDDLVALATQKRWSPTQILEHVADMEEGERSCRGLERRLSRSHLGRFKTIADYDWNWLTGRSSSQPSASTSSEPRATSCSLRRRALARP